MPALRADAASVVEVAVPHFSYHVAEAYDLDRLAGILEKLAGETAVFPIQSTGIAFVFRQ